MTECIYFELLNVFTVKRITLNVQVLYMYTCNLTPWILWKGERKTRPYVLQISKTAY